jgi:hypothetical protein
MTQPLTLEKDVQQSRLYFFDFSLWAEMSLGGAILTSAVVFADYPELVVGAVTVTPSQAQVRISGGNRGRIYKLKCIATTNKGDALVQQGFLSVS